MITRVPVIKTESDRHEDSMAVPAVSIISSSSTTSMATPLPELPISLWKHVILPLLDRASWNSLLAANAFLWRQRDSLVLPPWPRSATIRMKQREKSNNIITKLQISKEWVAIGCRDGSLAIWHVRDGGGSGRGEKIEIIRHHDGGEILALQLVNDDWLISVCPKRMVVWNLRDILPQFNSQRKKSPLDGKGIVSITPHWESDNHQHDGNNNFHIVAGFPKYPAYILSGSDQQPFLTVWKLGEEDGILTEENYIDEDGGTVEHIVISEDHIALVRFKTEIRLYKCSHNPHPEDILLDSCNSVTWNAHEHRIKALAFSPNGQFLASSSLGFLHNAEHEATIRVWNLRGEAICKWSPTDIENINIVSLCFVPSSRCHQVLATGGMIGNINVWDLTSSSTKISSNSRDEGRDGNYHQPQKMFPLKKYSHGEVWAVYALAAHGTTLASGSGDGTVRLWDVEV